MKTSFRKAIVELGMLVDLLLCGFSLLFATGLLSEPIWDRETLTLQHPLRSILLTCVLCMCWHISLIASGAYRSYRADRFRTQVKALAKGSTLVSLWFLAWLLLSFWRNQISGKWIVGEVFLFWGATFCSLVFTRLVIRILTRALRRHGRNLRNVLIVGSNRRAVELADRLGGRPELGFRIAGFVDDGWHDESAPEHYKHMLLGKSSSFLELLRNLAIDEVIIALPIASHYHFTEQIVDWCRQQGIPVRSEGTLFNVQRYDRDSMAELITHHEVRHAEWRVGAKRLVDIVVSGVALILLLPALAVIALLIKLGSPGPVLFAQERLGVNKRPFHIWKFRTMVVNAEALMAQVEHLNQSEGPTFKLKADPRITKLGAFLRKTSLDELPQLFNVLTGEMSLVGPRPLPMRDYQGFSADWHRRRFSVKPGITCLWQITGRSSIGFDRWMELDMDYIDRWSLWLDLQILVKTIPAVIRGSGAM